MTTFPPELIEIIVHEVWHSEMTSFIRQAFMTTCPQINRTWKAVYAPIASQDMYITNLAFLDYLCDISQAPKSIIYRDSIPRLTRTITCFVDLRVENEARETAAKGAYRYLVHLPNMRSFQALFKHVEHISFQIVWIGSDWDTIVPKISPLRGIPIRARYDRFLLSQQPSQLRMHISMKNRGFWWPGSGQAWLRSLSKLRDVGVPPHFFTTSISLGSCRETIRRGVRHFHYITLLHETWLGSWDINRHLWMASEGRHRDSTGRGVLPVSSIVENLNDYSHRYPERNIVLGSTS
ncbi:uncharacterized protein EV420DRAFT_1751153 [Desarmillaria tabescens]|uniref:Uncharacterized protein n=1 Tax=Armillaria tabescens TaxID=1929756 RepID=A0AA39JRY9_ARMTA|nr:uncharacterized protein EV420DRAFT_1751153 [Desarmillaria tabescens]KAK0447402.1 hypothetical protein EV420DRAFT_1751153 [Desarmillaria tabescens]